MLLLLGGVAYRLNTYLVAFSPGANWHYFPSLLELTLTFGIIATEIAIYIAVIKIFPILSGAPRLAPSRS
jgi:Ni/Fe-hydrogenase subunit HybB-like protein